MDDSWLLTNCDLSLLTREVIESCHPFTCGTDGDMDEFFRQDALDYTNFLMGKSYCFRLKDDLTTIVACFTVSNDSMRIYDLPSSRRITPSLLRMMLSVLSGLNIHENLEHA